jgi:hypothetical protein
MFVEVVDAVEEMCGDLASAASRDREDGPNSSLVLPMLPRAYADRRDPDREPDPLGGAQSGADP